MYTDYRVYDENVNDYQQYEKIIKKIKNRFMTYGYKRIKTPAFEKYDLYSEVNSSVNQREMIKVVNYTGDVLVIRPDVTIPITRKLAENYTNTSGELRYFYIQDVFRQPFDRLENIESTQAGIEYFGKRSAEADAEVIALACHSLTDLGFQDVKIEIGHAGFFQELISQINLDPHELIELKNIIQAKNVVDIRPFLDRIQIDENIANALEKIPFMYGNVEVVIEQVKDLLFTENLQNKLNHLIEVHEMIKMYGLEKNVIIDLGLINHMEYYSDIVFQGFVENFGQPVLMGGRYDQLATKFGAHIPAIGFACRVESLVEASSIDEQETPVQTDVLLKYEPKLIQQAISISNDLRDRNYSVVSYAKGDTFNEEQCRFVVDVNQEGNTVQQYNEVKTFTHLEELLKVLEGGF